MERENVPTIECQSCAVYVCYVLGHLRGAVGRVQHAALLHCTVHRVCYVLERLWVLAQSGLSIVSNNCVQYSYCSTKCYVLGHLWVGLDQNRFPASNQIKVALAAPSIALTYKCIHDCVTLQSKQFMQQSFDVNLRYMNFNLRCMTTTFIIIARIYPYILVCCKVLIKYKSSVFSK